MNFCIVDIETPLGNSSENFIMLARVKALGKKPAKLFTLKDGLGGDYGGDLWVVSKLREEMNLYDGWITWNGLQFDLPYIDDRLIINGVPRLKRGFARGLDTMWHAKQFKSMFQGASLEHVSIGLRYPGRVREPLNESIFVRAKQECLDKFKNGSEHFDRIERHNAGCVRLTEFCYEVLKPRIQNISRWG